MRKSQDRIGSYKNYLIAFSNKMILLHQTVGKTLCDQEHSGNIARLCDTHIISIVVTDL